MSLHSKESIRDNLEDDVYASSDLSVALPKYRFPKTEQVTQHAYSVVHDELMLDGNSRQNLATFCQTWAEPEVHQLMDECMDKNMIDKDEYPQTAEIEARCIHMLADLWNSPTGANTIGCSTTGSSEAAMLGGMAMKRSWEAKRKAAGKPINKPNMITGPVQICWHKFARYWDIELREIPMEKHSIARIRSMTKPFVGTSILMLCDKGELALDDPVSKYIPAWDTDVCRDIRIEQLLTHTAGFSQPGYPGSLMSFATLRDLVDATGAVGPQMTPGEQYNYSDADTATLGCIVAELSGMPVEDFIQKNFFDALGMTSSMCNLSTDDPRRPAVSKAAIARSSCSRVWGAMTVTLTRAEPRGTDGGRTA